MRSAVLPLVALLSVVAGSDWTVRLVAQGRTDLYADATLLAEASRYRQRVDELFQRGLVPFLDPAEKRALASTRIDLPLRGSHPLDAYSISSPAGRNVVLPILSLKFIEDLSIAYAWRYTKNHTLEPIDEYLGMLKYREPSAFNEGRFPNPLTALGVPANIPASDARVDDLSLRFRNTTWAFILAHELAHLRFQHPGNRGVDPALSQRNEAEADAFAVDLLGRSDTIPMGMILWFQASAAYFKNRADFPTDTAYLEWLRRESTHPINPQRLQALGVTLERAAGATLNRQHAETLRFIATRVVAMGDLLAEPDMQRLVARCAVLGNPQDLKRLTGRPCDERLTERTGRGK